MTDYTKLVEALRGLANGIWKNCEYTWFADEEKVFADAAAAIEALETEIRESMQKCAECGDEQEQKVKELQARLGEAENSVERWKDMYLTKHEPKLGEWIEHGEPPMYVIECSVCGQKYFNHAMQEKAKYCSMCGAKMEVQDDTCKRPD